MSLVVLSAGEAQNTASGVKSEGGKKVNTLSCGWPALPSTGCLRNLPGSSTFCSFCPESWPKVSTITLVQQEDQSAPLRSQAN